MKCAFCSTPLEPREWFCSNCKRSCHAAKPSRGARVWKARAVTVSMALVVGAAVGSQSWFRDRFPAPLPSLSAAQTADPVISMEREMIARDAGEGRLVPASFRVPLVTGKSY